MSEESSRLSNSKLSTLPTPTYACSVPRESTASPLPRGTSHSDQDHQSAGWLFGAERCWNKDLPRDMANGERYPVVDYRCSVCKGILTIMTEHTYPSVRWGCEGAGGQDQLLFAQAGLSASSTVNMLCTVAGWGSDEVHVTQIILNLLRERRALAVRWV